MKKLSSSLGPGLTDPSSFAATTAPVPQTSFENKPPPGFKGPKSLQGRNTYGKTNTGTPVVPQSLTTAQKNMPPPVSSEFSIKAASVHNIGSTMKKTQPSIKQLVKQAMAIGSGVSSSIEHVDTRTSTVTKLAHTLSKVANADSTGLLAHTENTESGTNAFSPGSMGEASTPKSTTSGLITIDGRQNMIPQEPSLEDSSSASLAPVTAPKPKSLAEEIKTAAWRLKTAAEDTVLGITPTPMHHLLVSEAEEGVPSMNATATSSTKHVQSNQAAIDATPKDAKEPIKNELGALIKERALSASTDPVLNKAFDNTTQAGAKIASNFSVSSFLKQASEEMAKAEQEEKRRKEEEERLKQEKEKNSMMGSNLSTPQGQSGFDSSSVGRI